MNAQELKAAIAHDVKTIRYLDFEIIPGPIYYGKLLKLGFICFALFWFIATLTVNYSGVHHPSNEGLAFEPPVRIMKDAAIFGFLLGALGTLLLFGAFNFYIQFRFHLEDKLKTGKFFVKKLQQIACLFITVLSLLCAFFGSTIESAAIFMMIGFAFVMALLVSYFLVRMELNRIGLSILFTASSEFFSKGRANLLPPN